MPAYNFKRKFGGEVENGLRQANGQSVPVGARIKRQTVRLRRKRPTKPGDTFYGYAGMRTKHCYKLGSAPVLSVEPVDIYNGNIKVNGRFLGPGERSKFIQDDGFVSEKEFFRFFEEHYGLPLVSRMEVIRW